ncbi:MAG: rhamnan synthesis F family protein [Azospirillaceae bacterium]|nr:rhamnan synthesis F family protein [Azospirillaceae bacterium]
MSNIFSGLIRKVSRFSLAAIDLTDLAIAQARPLLGARAPVKERLLGDRPLEGARKVAVFNHFDSRGVVHDYVVYFVKHLADAGYAVIFASNCPKLSEEQTAKVRPYVSRVLKRRNLGWDFGAFKDAIDVIPDPAALEHLLITNDSIYGPLQDLSEVISKADPEVASIWGLTDNWDQQFHLQSYFLIFHQAALQHPSFGRFWQKVRYYRRKRWVIRDYEIGLTRYFLRAGLHCRALLPYRSLIAELAQPLEVVVPERDKSPVAGYLRLVKSSLHNGTPLNQTHYFWDYLITTKLCPFIKRDLLQRNPVGVPYVQRWEEVVRSASTYDTSMIVHHLQLSMRNRVH